MTRWKYPEILFPIVTTVLGVIVGVFITLQIQSKENKEKLVFKIAACFNEFTENTKIIKGLWDENKLEQKISANSISFESLNLLLNDPQLYEFLTPYYTSFICPKLRRSKKITEYFLLE